MFARPSNTFFILLAVCPRVVFGTMFPSIDFPLKDEAMNLASFNETHLPFMVTEMIGKLSPESIEKIGNAFNPYKRYMEKEENGSAKNSTFTPTIECGQVISTMTRDEVRELIYNVFYYLFNKDNPGGWISRKVVDFLYSYGVETRKICASCTDFYDEYGGGENAPEMFENYCGPDTYGNDAVVSGLLQIPLDDNGKSYLEGDHKGVLSMRWIQWQAKDGASENYPPTFDDFYADITQSVDPRNLKDFFPLFTTALGAVTIVPDYMGFGESYNYYKSVHQKRVYQAGVIPLVLKAKEILPEVTDNKVTLRMTGFGISGFSEGCIPAIASTRALENLGFNVRFTTAGGCGYDSVTVNGVMKIMEMGLNPQAPSESGETLMGFFPMIAATYSSIYDDAPNTNMGQDMLSEEWREEALKWFRTVDGGLDLSGREFFATLFPGGNAEIFRLLLNPDFAAMFSKAIEQGSEYVCDHAEVGKTDKLCEAIEANDMRYLVEQTNSPFFWCYSKGDVFQNVPSFISTTLNLNLLSIGIPSFVDDPFLDHSIAAGICSLITYLVYASAIFRL